MNNASELRPTVGYDNTLTHTSLAMKEYFGEKKKQTRSSTSILQP